MKKIKNFALLLIILTTFSMHSPIEEQWVYGPTVATSELHNVVCGGNIGCDCDGGEWCQLWTEMNLSVPNQRWTFVGQTQLELVEDNQNSSVWNRLGDPRKFKVTLDNPTEKRAKVLTGSRAIRVRIKCLAKSN